VAPYPANGQHPDEADYYFNLGLRSQLGRGAPGARELFGHANYARTCEDLLGHTVLLTVPAPPHPVLSMPDGTPVLVPSDASLDDYVAKTDRRVKKQRRKFTADLQPIYSRFTAITLNPEPRAGASRTSPTSLSS